nr:hypothetical protein Itr_chr07CG10860 [Ipomoea trifida]
MLLVRRIDSVAAAPGEEVADSEGRRRGVAGHCPTPPDLLAALLQSTVQIKGKRRRGIARLRRWFVGLIPSTPHQGRRSPAEKAKEEHSLAIAQHRRTCSLLCSSSEQLLLRRRSATNFIRL